MTKHQNIQKRAKFIIALGEVDDGVGISAANREATATGL
jgi:hypothetical protein